MELTEEMLKQLTPLMKQYLEVKKQYTDCILLYRIGDFYEMFFDDAFEASRALELTLTGKDCGLEERAPMCGIPYHAADAYIPRLVTRGYKVAICEQVEDPALAKGLVKRDVTRVITPGTVIESNILEEKKNNYVASIYRLGMSYGFAYSDVSTGEFYATQFNSENNLSKVMNELARILPAEIVVNQEMFMDNESMNTIKDRFNTYISMQEYVEENKVIIKNQKTYEELKSMQYAEKATQILLEYIQKMQKIDLKHINDIEIYSVAEFMILDNIARRNLELTETLRDRNKKGSLLWVLDKTATSMGGRMLRKWLEKPLISINEIHYRNDGVSELKENLMLRGDVFENLRNIYDIERLVGKIAYGTVNARDLIALKNSLYQIPKIKKLLCNCSSSILKDMHDKLDELQDVADLIEASIMEEPPVSVKEGDIIKSEYNEDVNEYRKAAIDGKTWILNLEAEEREKTGIKNLKVSYNKVFGYYIEVTKGNKSLVPERYEAKQTLTNGERYITKELKEMEGKILGAQDKVVRLEYEIFVEIRNQITNEIKRLQDTAHGIAILDALNSLATVADERQYVKPDVDNSEDIIIHDGRHPVVEALIPSGSFVPNNTTLDTNENRVNIITGPNMAGKSTYMRQVALITLMAQIGSFVPASYAKIGIVDRIFTRVGASDDLSTGQSTFMVEMSEVANILDHATRKSLLILDEIGRGTSTFDGLSIAWAVVEYISDKSKIGARTLFATHYHELTELETKLDGVRNYCVAVKEKGEDIIFLRKIIEGGADESYGVHVAKLAGIPSSVTSRANTILKELKETNIANKSQKENKKPVTSIATQFDLFNYKLGEIASELEKVNLDELRPLDALNILAKMKSKL